jgi:hypothetical protein
LEHQAQFDAYQQAIYDQHWHPRIGDTCECGGEPAAYTCRECFGAPALCAACIVAAHRHHPFHWVDHWNGVCFDRKDLCELGAVVYLGHYGGMCPGVDWEAQSVHTSTIRVTVVDRNGIHRARLRMCVCPPHSQESDRRIQGKQRRDQMLSAGLFPATTGPYPETVFTFALLEEYRILTLHTKMNTRDFMEALQRLTYGLVLGKKTVSRRAPCSAIDAELSV